MAQSPGGIPFGGLRPHLMIMDKAMTTAPRTPVIDEHGNVVGEQWSAKSLWSAPETKRVEPYSPDDERITREAWREISQSLPRDPQSDLPTLVVRQANIPTGATVMVMWGEARFMIGVVTGRRDGGYYVNKIEGPGASCLVVPEALGVVLSEPPTFDSAEAAEDWLLRSGEQEWFPGDMVRVSERRDREQMIVHGRIVKYLGIQGKEPPKYLVDIHGEPKITASYFIKGRA